MKYRRPLERGQILVLFVFALVVLLGFMALAIDVGMLFSDRRQAQNAADTAATEGALLLAQNKSADEVRSAALAIAAQNGYDNNGTTNWVEVVYPYKGDSQLVQVKIKAITKTNFIQLFNKGVAENQVESVVKLKTAGPALAGYSLYVLDNDCSEGGIGFKGGGNADPSVDIEQGGAFSRSCLHGNNNSHNFIRADGAISCLDSGGAYACGTVGGFSPAATVVNSDPLTDFKITLPDCSDRTIAPARTASGDILEPGYYTNVGSATKLKPGLYCIDGTEFSKTLTTIAGNGFSEGVTIVFMSDGASFKYTGNAKWNLKAARPNGNNAPNVIPGAVIVSDVEYSIEFTGNAEASFWGTVYSPKAHFDMGGTADAETVCSQIIVHDYNAHGTNTLQMKYDSSWFYQAPAQLSLYR
jgi:Flp pilus assembly protein TadG